MNSLIENKNNKTWDNTTNYKVFITFVAWCCHFRIWTCV